MQIGQERMHYQLRMGAWKSRTVVQALLRNGGAINSSRQGMKHILLDILSLESRAKGYITRGKEYILLIVLSRGCK
jgi:hypothetical protein